MEKEFQLNGYWINGLLADFNPAEFIQKVKDSKRALHTNRLVDKNDPNPTIYSIHLDAFGDINNPRSIYVDIVQIDFINGEEKQERIYAPTFRNWEAVQGYLEMFKINNPALKKSTVEDKKYPNLQKVLDELNASSEEDGETYASEFDFKTQIVDGRLYIYDANENYHIYYEEDLNYMLKDLADEFDFEYKFTPDTVLPRLEKAIKKDFGHKAYIEWETNVRMLVVEE